MDHTMSRAEVRTIIDQAFERIPGWCPPEKGKRLAALAYGSELCVELGVFGGRGLVAMALALKDQQFGRADGIDPFTAAAALEGTNDPVNDEWWGRLDYDAVAKSAQTTLYRMDLVPYAHLIRLPSRDVAEFYSDGSVDLLHQDSNHSEEVSCEEVTLWTPKIKVGGHWVFDDTDWTSTRKAQGMLAGLGFKEIEDRKSWKVYRRDRR
jgi:methyltransferase family protein